MSLAEKSYGFMVTESALESVDSPIRTMLQVLAGCTETTPLVSILQMWFIKHAGSYVKQSGIFNVLSYHGRNGHIVNAMTDGGDLRPTQNVTNAARHPPGLIYVKVEADLQFMDIDPSNNMIYPFSYFVCLYNEQAVVPNSTGNELSLNTFHGDDNWATAWDQATLDARIWNHPRSLTYPFVLIPPKIDNIHADAIVKSSSSGLERLALEAAWSTITTTKIFQQVCPNITQDPAAVIQNIHQSSQIDGVAKEFTTEEFFNVIQRMTGFFPHSDDMPWPIDVTQHFLTHCNASDV
jgi:hypothetical protein